MDFLEYFHTIINIPRRQFEFEFPANCKNQQIEEFLAKRVEELLELRKDYLLVKKEDNINLAKETWHKKQRIYCQASKTYFLNHNELHIIPLLPVGKALQWGVSYQVILMQEKKRFPSLEPLIDHFTTNNQAPTDIVFIEVKILHSIKIDKGAKLAYLLPLKKETVALLDSKVTDFEIVSNPDHHQCYQPLQIFPELPLPNQQEETQLTEYTNEDRIQALQDFDRYVTIEETNRFITPHPGIKLLAGDEEVADVQLVLFAKVLKKVPAKVWYDANDTGLFPGIPEEEVTIPVPLRCEIPVKQKSKMVK